MVSSALAYFTDVETSTNNNFTVGMFDLQIADRDEWFGKEVTAAWTMSNMAPGVTTIGPFSITLHNSGNIAANHVEIVFRHVIDKMSYPMELDSDSDSTRGDMARWMEITTLTFGNQDFVRGYIDCNGNGIFDLEDVTQPAYARERGLLDGLPAPDGTEVKVFTISLKFSKLATNDIQGDALTTTVSFTLNQDAGQ